MLAERKVAPVLHVVSETPTHRLIPLYGSEVMVLVYCPLRLGYSWVPELEAWLTGRALEDYRASLASD